MSHHTKASRRNTQNITIAKRQDLAEIFMGINLYQRSKAIFKNARVGLGEDQTEAISQLEAIRIEFMMSLAAIKIEVLRQVLQSLPHSEIESLHEYAQALAKAQLPANAYITTPAEAQLKGKLCEWARKHPRLAKGLHLGEHKWAIGPFVPDVLLPGFTLKGVNEKFAAVALEADGNIHDLTGGRDDLRRTCLRNREICTLELENGVIALNGGKLVKDDYLANIVPVGTRVRMRFMKELYYYNIAFWLSFREIEEATGGKLGVVNAAIKLIAEGTPCKSIAAALRAGAPQIDKLLTGRGTTVFEIRSDKVKEFAPKTVRRSSNAMVGIAVQPR